ncbi:MAG: hypothetical protein AAFX75_17260, partial [Pseudomonadota bacterium]
CYRVMEHLCVALKLFKGFRQAAIRDGIGLVPQASFLTSGFFGSKTNLSLLFRLKKGKNSDDSGSRKRPEVVN